MAGGRDSVLLVYVNGTEAAPVRVDMLGALVTVGPPTRDELLRWVGPESRAKAVDDAIERGSSK